MYYTIIEDNLIMTRHNSLSYEYEAEYNSYDLDYSEKLNFDFGDVRSIIHADIKYLFNYDRRIDGNGRQLDELNANNTELWKNFFTHFVKTLWEDEREIVFRKCFDYAEACLVFHRECCDYCQPDGDCSATSIWKLRIAESAQVINELYNNKADSIFKKYVSLPHAKQQKLITPNTFLKKQVHKKVVDLLQPYFAPAVHNQLKNFLIAGTVPEEKLVFNDNGNKLADIFKQLYNNGYVIGKKKRELIELISKSFQYRLLDSNKELKVKYLSTIIESGTIHCKKPLTDVRKW